MAKASKPAAISNRARKQAVMYARVSAPLLAIQEEERSVECDSPAQGHVRCDHRQGAAEK
jgi:hypothetical protein